MVIVTWNNYIFYEQQMTTDNDLSLFQLLKYFQTPR